MVVLVEFAGTERFQIERRLGAGGMGVVYLAFDRERETRVALKTLRDRDGNALYLFKQEFRQLADLHHPNLVRLGELICDGGHWFFTMEFVDGVNFLAHTRTGAVTADGSDVSGSAATCESLTRMAEASTAPVRLAGSGYDEARLRVALRHLAQGVDALHQANKVHRDIKPSNILCTPAGRAVLVDFGLVADVTEEGRFCDQSVVGTPTYMAPEQGASRPATPRADWYSVGAVLYEALTGCPPFQGAPIDVLMNKQRYEPAPPRAVVPDVPADLDALCVALLRTSPDDRPLGHEVLARLGVPATQARRSALALSSVTSLATSFVGRQREQAQLRSAYETSQTGHTVSLFVSGESGVGKTTLVRRFLDGLRAEREAPLTLSCRCYEWESVPFRAFDGIVDALSHHLAHLDPVEAALLLPRDVGALARIFPVLRRVAAVEGQKRPKHHSPLELRTRAFAALRELLTRLAAHKPVVLFIDDFQWADKDSVALLREVLHAPEGPPLLLLCTVRTESVDKDAATWPTGTIARELGDARHLDLGVLPPDEARELAARLLHVAPGEAPSGVDAIVEEGRGHPLFIHELARHVDSLGAPGTIRFFDALWSRVRKLEPPARQILEVVAVAGAPTANDVIAQAAGLSAAEFGQWAPLLRTAHLIRQVGMRTTDRVEAYHDRVREAVLGELDPETRRLYHGRLANALESAAPSGAEPLALVRHLQAAGEIERAADHAERAARRAGEGLAFDQAADLYKTALELGSPTEDQARSLRLAWGEALINAGRGPEAAEVLLVAAEGADRKARFDCQRRAAEQLLGSGLLERGREVLGCVLAEIGEHGSRSSLRALASIVWNRARLRLSGYRWKRAKERPSTGSVARLEVYRAVAMGIGMVDVVQGADFEVRGLRVALRLGDPGYVARFMAMEAMFLAVEGGRNLDRAKRLADEVSRVAAELGQPYPWALSLGSQGVCDLCAGRLRQAAETLWEGELKLREATTGTYLELANGRIFRLLALRLYGDLDELKPRFHEYVRDAVRRGDQFTATTLSRAFGVVWLADDDPGAVAQALESRTWTPPEGGYHIQHQYELLLRVELALYLGDAESAWQRLQPDFAALFGSLLMRLQIVRVGVFWYRARLALGAAQTAAQPEPLLNEAERMARKLLRERLPFSDVWVELVRAGICARRGDRTGALTHLRRAMALSEGVLGQAYLEGMRYREGQVRGGASGARISAKAEEYLVAHGIRNVRRFLNVPLPGFGDGSAADPP
jgi:serine/threonine protein kinase